MKTLIDEETFAVLTNTWSSFKGEEDNVLAKWFIVSKTTATYFDAFFKTFTDQKGAKRGSFSPKYKLR